MPYNYSDAEVLKRMGGGPDQKRKATYDQWLIQAKAGDKVALRKLYLQADPDGPGGGGAGTRDSRNYLRMILRDQGPLLQSAGHDPTPIQGYMEQGDAQFNLKNTIGGILKTAAPFASLIPGVGIPLAAGMAAGGSALGGALQGDKFNLAKTLLAGAAGGGGAALLGGQGFKGIGGIPGRLGIGGGGAGQAAAAGGGGGGWKDSIMRGLGVGGGGGFDPLKLLGVGASVAGGIDAHGRAQDANRAMSDARNMATSAYQGRQPLETAANTALMRGMGGMKLGEQWAPTQSEAGTMAQERMRKLGQRGMPTNPVLARAMG